PNRFGACELEIQETFSGLGSVLIGHYPFLRCLDIDLSHNRILLPQTKDGDSRIVYLRQPARAALTSPPFNNRLKQHIFTIRGIRAGWLRVSGADIHTVAQLLGHKDRMTSRFQHLSPGNLADTWVDWMKSFGIQRYQEVTNQKAPTDGISVSAS